MENQEIRIVTLPPMRVASFYAFSASPELEAWSKVVDWAKEHGCWEIPPSRRIFGFDNPSPSTGSPNYGYEFWLTIDPAELPDREAQIKEFSGGLYGVLNCDVSAGNPYDIIPSTWGKLVKWLESSHYKHGRHQWLEEHLTRFDSNDKGFVLDLFIPITE
jgi:AraC family transcriptional regulator